MYALKMLMNQKLRLALTVGGISLCIVLMIFLLGVYRGVADGSVEYIQKNKVDLWVLQKNCTNILRGTSLLPASNQIILEEDDDVETVSPVFLILVTIKYEHKSATTFLTGYYPQFKYGGPPEVIEGSAVQKDNEIVVDKSFARKYKMKVGSLIQIQDKTLKVSGLSGGTNAFVIQYSFTTLHQAQSIIGFSNIVTAYLIKLKPGSSIELAKERLQQKLPGAVVYNYSDFLKNNIKEMESGFLPILYAVALISALVLTTILSLILSISILERQKEFAVMKTLGAPGSFFINLIVEQSLSIAILSTLAALIIFFPVVSLIENLSPEVSTKTNLVQIISVVLIAVIMSLISSFISLGRLRRIYPLEAFK